MSRAEPEEEEEEDHGVDDDVKARRLPRSLSAIVEDVDFFTKVHECGRCVHGRSRVPQESAFTVEAAIGLLNAGCLFAREDGGSQLTRPRELR
jgi:hypothetical protein